MKIPNTYDIYLRDRNFNILTPSNGRRCYEGILKHTVGLKGAL